MGKKKSPRPQAPLPLPPIGWANTRFSEPRNQRQEDRLARQREDRVSELEPLESANKKRGERENPEPEWREPAKKIAKETWEKKGFEYPATLIEINKLRKREPPIPGLPARIEVLRVLRDYRKELLKEPQK
jgi:hypothetical protein